ncbi:MAG: L,D-transpeptidase [bacterium]
MNKSFYFLIAFLVIVCLSILSGCKVDGQNNPVSKDSLKSLYGYNETDLAKFQNRVNKTIEQSRIKKSKAIIIDKMRYELLLIDSGEIDTIFNVELGRDPISDKFHEDGRTTPEGFYKVSRKLNIGQTSFYKALYVNYPNELDRHEYDSLKSIGAIEKGIGIGGQIEIHGCGSGKKGNEGGYNWTLGCIALSNKDMDYLFEKVKVNTPITIVKYKEEL